MRLYQQGFTLTEALLTVLIIGILVSVALPSYMGSLAKSRRVEAKTLALNIASLQERYFLQRGTYTTRFGDEGLGLDGNKVSPNGLYMWSENDFYRASVRACPAGDISTCYEVRVKTMGEQSELDPECDTFFLNNLGDKWVVAKSTAFNEQCW